MECSGQGRNWIIGTVRAACSSTFEFHARPKSPQDLKAPCLSLAACFHNSKSGKHSETCLVINTGMEDDGRTCRSTIASFLSIVWLLEFQVLA